jgi:hypothetical protein
MFGPLEPYDGSEIDLSQFQAEWGEQADYHTPYREFVWPGRRVLVIPGFPSWPYTPEDCPGTQEYGTRWLLDDSVLVCMGCGLDST